MVGFVALFKMVTTAQLTAQGGILDQIKSRAVVSARLKRG